MKKLLGALLMTAALVAATAEPKPYIDELKKTDGEFAEFFENFADEVTGADGVSVDEKTRHIALLSAVIGRGAVDFYKPLLSESLENGVSAIEAREILYQAVAYCGLARVYPFFSATSEIFKKKRIKLPLPPQGTASKGTRLEKGVKKQVEIFGSGMSELYKKSVMNRWLAENCFGDYYTRGGLTTAQRELATFCYIAADGTNEAQLCAHITANSLVGNKKPLLIAVAHQLTPYLGYPRTLNIITAINQTLTEEQE